MDKKRCFVICPIGEQDSDTRRRSDQVLRHIIKPAVESCGFVAERADEIDKPGLITSQVIQRVVNDPLVIADLTERNPNVFYELAIRHAIRKPLVQLIKKGERIPFDVAGTRTIQVDHQDLDSVESARGDIVNQIKALERDSDNLETPISVSLDLQVLRQSDKPEDRSLADMLAAISEMRAGFAKLEARVSSPEMQSGLERMTEQMRVILARLDEQSESMGPRRGARVNAMMVHEMAHQLVTQDNSRDVAVLFVASLFRDSMPWLYEAAKEVYYAKKRGDVDASRTALNEFRSLAEMSLHGPWSRDLLGGSKEGLLWMEELSWIVRHFPFDEDAPKRTKRRPEI